MIPRHTLPVLSAALLLVPSFALAQDEEEQAYFGTYTYVKGMRGDEPVPDEDLKGQKVEIEEGELELIGPEGEELFEIRYTIDKESPDGSYQASLEIIESSAMPDSVGSKGKALAKHDGDTITLIYDYSDGADYPGDFEPDGPMQHLFVLKKSADAEEEDDDKEDDDPEDDPR